MRIHSKFLDKNAIHSLFQTCYIEDHVYLCSYRTYLYNYINLTYGNKINLLKCVLLEKKNIYNVNNSFNDIILVIRPIQNR